MEWASRFMTRRLHKWDRWFHQFSKGRWTATEILSGIPVIFIKVPGARTGIPRTTPLLSIQDGDKYILIATKFGADHHPDWLHNLRANPEVEVEFKGNSSRYRANELEGQARVDAWEVAVRKYPGYQAYEERAGGRVIPVVVLSPLKS